MTLSDLYGLMAREFPGLDPVDLAIRGYYWVMDLSHYKQIRAAAHAAGAVYPSSDPDDWIPSPEDRLFGLPVEVRENGGDPHLVCKPSWMSRMVTTAQDGSTDHGH